MNRILIVAAFSGELKPLVRHWKKSGNLFHGRIGDADASAVFAGMGANAVRRAVEPVIAGGETDTLISVGWAGSLSCGLQAGEAFPVREVIDARTGEIFATALALESLPQGTRAQRLLTLDHVAGRDEKRALAQQHQAVMVDMEAATVARLARERDLPFFCFKGISDGPNDLLPDFNRFTGPDGQLRLPALLAWAAVHPQSWRPLLRLGENSRKAAENLANFPRFLSGSL